MLLAAAGMLAVAAIANTSAGPPAGGREPGISQSVDTSASTDGTRHQRQEWGATLAMLERGRRIFRFDTFGDEAFWGGTLRLHEAIEGARFGGVGPGLTPAAALGVGLKVDADALSPATLDAIRRGRVNLNDPAVTLALLEANAVVGGLSQARSRWWVAVRRDSMRALPLHYNSFFSLSLSERQKRELIEYLKSL
jgi:hypothetical protein